ncbi:CcmD family protein [Pontibacter sp. H249]|uniref:CcmD family protein n=1 Tax=Pontibacter sp. H249 TaxID=3133420 RepID=UPI0030BC2400
MKLFRILAVWCFILFAAAGIQQAQAQQPEMRDVEFSSAPPQQEIEMADTLRQDGKIYVVVVVLLTVLGGMIAYLVTLDRKVSRLEKQMRD